MSKFPDERHARLDVLAGTWDTTITLLNADGSDGAVSSATDVYRWTSSGCFLVHDVDATMGGESVQSLEIIAVGPDGAGYVTRSYDADGTINDFVAALDGDNWTISGQVQRFSGRFSTDRRTLTGRWEQRENGRWAPLMTVRLEKRV